MITIVAAWARLELTRRWRALVVLALLVAVATTTVLAAVAGARRADTAVDRLRAQTLPASLGVLPNLPDFDWDAVRALPGVDGVGEFAVTGYQLTGLPDPQDESTQDESAMFPIDRRMLHEVERPVLLAGRLPDPDRADEAVVTSRFLDTYDCELGDVVDVRLFTPQEVDESFGSSNLAAAATGPVVPTTVVGVVRSPWFSDGPGTPGGFTPSAGLLEQYPDNLLGHQGMIPVNALVRLADESPAGIEAFRAALAGATGRSDIEMMDLVAMSDKIGDALSFEATSLLAFGLAALAAAVVLVGQAVVRYVAAAVADLQVLRAVGMERRAALAAAAVPAVLAGTLGVLAGVAGAIAVSPLFPIGTAGDLEPAPGLSVDPLVLGAGGGLLLALLVGGAFGAGRVALAAGRTATGRRSAAAALAGRVGLPVPVLVGLRFALEPGRGRSAVPVRPALLGAVTGVLGVLAAATFSAGVTEAADNPDRFGQTHRVETFTGFDGQDFVPDVDALVATAAADPDVRAVVDSPMGVLDAGSGAVTVFSYGSRGPEPFPTVVLAGRMPTAPDEILLATATADDLGVGVGGRIPAAGNRGQAELTVTGIGFVPYAGHNNYDDGGWLTPDGYAALIDGFKFHIVYLALHPGTDAEAVVQRMAAATGQPFQATAPLLESAQLSSVEVLPRALGAFLALLAVGAVGHALATAVRRRRHDVAVLRALGMTRWQTRGIVITQATTLAAVGLLIGLPLGVAAGRVLWRVVADITPLQYQAPVVLLAVLVAVPVAVLLANALATWPGRRAARLRIATVLRAE